ncbi:MAG: hypothetical protein KBS79_06220 [Lachnospiraceae bacterium]|nr:hypothetical protein [Candidatus Minthocola equi]
MEVPVYVFTGFMDSGKTTLLKETLESPDFDSAKTLILACEDGDNEYEDIFLSQNKAVLVQLPNPDQLTDDFLAEQAKTHKPSQVLIEYNGMWELDRLFDRKLPRDWEFYGVFSTVDTSTADMYLSNMRQLFMAQFAASGLIIFNRCAEIIDRGRLRRIFKTFNPQAQLIFERPDGEVYDPTKEPLPYDMNADVIEIDDLDFGIWYLDAGDHPEDYVGKKLRFLAQVYRGRDIPKNTFVPGRFIMTCCINDVQFLGYFCECDDSFAYKSRDWVKVTCKFDMKNVPSMGGRVPYMTLVDIAPAAPPAQDPIFFS